MEHLRPGPQAGPGFWEPYSCYGWVGTVLQIHKKSDPRHAVPAPSPIRPAHPAGPA
ncbi:Hypothetical protein FKW44_001167 [Caligus rogercresseyi]|uniref:Uncharacterized protein n=1 Tax=Caligus rogercresseyi TaxID=217165 RepID=A0A7T8KIJ9_CALRO|nr:Hypothetical protein FKW44_001167 [Caligus rogercresseyi]